MAPPRNSGFEGEALGLLETKGLIAALEGTDAMLKAASVRLVRQERTVPALITCIITGETAAVQSAIDAGRAAAERVGSVISAHVIPRPAREVLADLGISEARSSFLAPSVPASRSNYEAMTVVELRRLARERADKDFSGRTISKASKKDLLRFFARKG